MMWRFLKFFSALIPILVIDSSSVRAQAAAILPGPVATVKGVCAVQKFLQSDSGKELQSDLKSIWTNTSLKLDEILAPGGSDTLTSDQVTNVANEVAKAGKETFDTCVGAFCSYMKGTDTSEDLELSTPATAKVETAKVATSETKTEAPKIESPKTELTNHSETIAPPAPAKTLSTGTAESYRPALTALLESVTPLKLDLKSNEAAPHSPREKSFDFTLEDEESELSFFLGGMVKGKKSFAQANSSSGTRSTPTANALPANSNVDFSQSFLLNPNSAEFADGGAGSESLSAMSDSNSSNSSTTSNDATSPGGSTASTDYIAADTSEIKSGSSAVEFQVAGGLSNGSFIANAGSTIISPALSMTEGSAQLRSSTMSGFQSWIRSHLVEPLRSLANNFSFLQRVQIIAGYIESAFVQPSVATTKTLRVWRRLEDTKESEPPTISKVEIEQAKEPAKNLNIASREIPRPLQGVPALPPLPQENTRFAIANSAAQYRKNMNSPDINWSWVS